MPKRFGCRRLFMGLLFSFCVAVQWGCPSGAQMRGPRTTAKGKLQVNVMPNTLGAVASAAGTTASSAAVTGVVPSVDAALFYGLTDFMDLQIHINAFAYITAGMGFQLLRSKFFDLSTSFDIGGTFFGIPGGPSIGYLTFPLKLLGGINLHERFAINLSAGYQGFYFFAGTGGGTSGASASLFAHTVITSLGFDIRITDFFTLRPQGSLMIPMVGTGFVSGLLWNAGLGLVFHFGGSGATPATPAKPAESGRRFVD